jgi:hypothetical protein
MSPGQTLAGSSLLSRKSREKRGLTTAKADINCDFKCLERGAVAFAQPDLGRVAEKQRASGRRPEQQQRALKEKDLRCQCELFSFSCSHFFLFLLFTYPAIMSFLGGAECSTGSNPLAQFSKVGQQDTSLQRDRLVGRGPGAQESMRSQVAGPGQENVGECTLEWVRYLLTY